jgi:hypothetical protein
MARPSSIDKFPPEIREEIGRLRLEGVSIDDILAHLRAMQGGAFVPSRSALGRHVKGLEAVTERIRNSRAVAEAVVKQLGDAPESHAARMNIELLHTAVLELFAGAADEGSVFAPDAKSVMFLAKAMADLAGASKKNVDFIAAVEKRAAERAKTAASAAVELVARERGISADTLNAIKAGIFGVRAAA